MDRFGGIDEAVAEAARRAKLGGDAATARYFDPPKDTFTQFISALTGGQARVSARPVVRDWLSHAALRQQGIAARVVADLRGLIEGPSIRADCLECRAYGAAPVITAREQAGWFGALLNWAGMR